MDQIPPNPPSSQNPTPLVILSQKRIPWKVISIGAGILVVLLLILLVGFIYLLPRMKVPADKIIAKVGEEKIYQKDVVNDSVYSSAGQNDLRSQKQIVEKLVTDSIILQAASKEGLITLNEAVFNSKTKIYPQRITALNNIKKTLEEKQKAAVDGAYVTIFFNNYPFISPLGAGKAKEIAKAKLTDLYNQVKNKTITIKEAGQRLKDDASLQEIDPVYQQNAYKEFHVNPDNPTITFVTEFNDAVWQLKEGELTPIILGKDTSLTDSTQYEAIYLFGQVTKITKGNGTNSVATWIEDKRRQYEVVYY